MTSINEVYELCGRLVNVRRLDLDFRLNLYPNWQGADHGKMGAIWTLLEHWHVISKIRKVACFASEGSNWALGLARIANALEMDTRVYMCTAPSWAADGLHSLPHTELVKLRANYLPIVSRQARNLSEADGFTFVPFGFEHPVAMDYLSAHLDFDDDSTIVLAAGSGITLACLLARATLRGRKYSAVHAVSTGRTVKMIERTVQRHAPLSALICQIHKPIDRYGASNIQSVFPTHAYYERKAYQWLTDNIHALKDPIWFVNM